MKKRNVRRKHQATLVFILAVVISGLGVLFALGFHSGEAGRSGSEGGPDRHSLFSPPRGGIFDRNLRELAVNARAYSVYAHPLEIDNSLQAASLLSGYLKTDKSNLLAMLRSETAIVSLGCRLEREQAESIRNLNLKGIYVTEEICRFYPGDDLAAQVIGFTDTEGHGIDGLEFTCDHVLSGSSFLPGINGSGSSIPLDRKNRSAEERKNVVLTLDSNIQALAEKQLEWIVADNRARSGIMIVMDTRSGAIMAMATYPSYNPNTFWEADALVRRNRAIADTFELGSLVRFFEGVAVSESVPAARNEAIEGETAENEENIVERPSPGTLYSLLQRFGFGVKTGISLPAENPGAVQPYKAYQSNPERLYRGEGIQVTPLQLVRAFAAMVNGGALPWPHLVARIADDRGNTVLQERRPVLKQACSSIVSGQVRSGLINGGFGSGNCIIVTASNAVPARSVNEGNEQVLDNPVAFDYIRCLLGSAPADSPEIAALIVLEGTSDKEKWPDKTGEQRFEYTTRESLRLARITPHEKAIALRPEKEYRIKASPDDPGPPIEGVPDAFFMPDLRGKCVREVLRILHPHGVEVKVSGSGVAVAQCPAAGARIGKGSRCQVRLEPENNCGLRHADCGMAKQSCEYVKESAR
ncbi:MAG: penicillin-binding transpeptidase domain-containing protein [Pseudomonadota bacterium]